MAFFLNPSLDCPLPWRGTLFGERLVSMAWVLFAWSPLGPGAIGAIVFPVGFDSRGGFAELGARDPSLGLIRWGILGGSARLPRPPKDNMKRRLYCTVPQKLIREPLLFNLANQFDIIPNLRGASVTEEIAVLTLELEGEEAAMENAVQYLVDAGVQIEDLQEDTGT